MLLLLCRLSAGAETARETRLAQGTVRQDFQCPKGGFAALHRDAAGTCMNAGRGKHCGML